MDRQLFKNSFRDSVWNFSSNPTRDLKASSTIPSETDLKLAFALEIWQKTFQICFFSFFFEKFSSNVFLKHHSAISSTVISKSFKNYFGNFSAKLVWSFFCQFFFWNFIFQKQLRQILHSPLENLICLSYRNSFDNFFKNFSGGFRYYFFWKSIRQFCYDFFYFSHSFVNFCITSANAFVSSSVISRFSEAIAKKKIQRNWQSKSQRKH